MRELDGRRGRKEWRRKGKDATKREGREAFVVAAEIGSLSRVESGASAKVKREFRAYVSRRSSSLVDGRSCAERRAPVHRCDATSWHEMLPLATNESAESSTASSTISPSGLQPTKTSSFSRSSTFHPIIP